jgi:hypothetical protein
MQRIPWPLQHQYMPIQRTPGMRAGDEALARELLAALPEIERRAVARYYRGFQGASDIESSFQWAPGRLAEIRMELKKQFFAKLVASAPRSVACDSWIKEGM